MSMSFIQDAPEFTADQAFLYSLGQAVDATVHCLSAAGVSEREIWLALGRATGEFQQAVVETDTLGEFASCLKEPVKMSLQSA